MRILEIKLNNTETRKMLVGFILIFSAWTFHASATRAAADQVEKETSSLQTYGGPCDPATEARFHEILKKVTDPDLGWASEAEFESVCNPFKFLKCVENRCSCCNSDVDYRMKSVIWDSRVGKCRIALGSNCQKTGKADPRFTRQCFTNPLFKPIPAYIPDHPPLSICKDGWLVSAVEENARNLLDFGNNDLENVWLEKDSYGLGKVKPCNINEEKRFLGELEDRGNGNDFKWMESYNSTCNVFKYLRCDPISLKCICWHDDLFWAPETDLTRRNPTSNDFGQFVGSCRIKLRRQDSCDSNHTDVHTVLEKYKKPYGLAIFDRISVNEVALHKLKTIDSPHLRCVPNSWNTMGRFECEETGNTIQTYASCKTGAYYLAQEMKFLREIGAKDTDWSFPPDDICEERKQDELLRDKIPFTWDFDRIRDIITLQDTRDYCNPFAYQECYRGVCVCQRPKAHAGLSHGEKENHFLRRNNRCIPEEGIPCTRRYWHNGNWVDLLDECDENFECVLAPDGMNYVCCDPQELKEHVIKITDRNKGRCRDQLYEYNGIRNLVTKSGVQLTKTSLLSLVLVALLLHFSTFKTWNVELS